MNTNPYPKGRWTSPKLNEANPVRTSFVDVASRLDQARLSELFWATTESPILYEARQRIERLIHAAVGEEVNAETSRPSSEERLSMPQAA